MGTILWNAFFSFFVFEFAGVYYTGDYLRKSRRFSTNFDVNVEKRYKIEVYRREKSLFEENIDRFRFY